MPGPTRMLTIALVTVANMAAAPAFAQLAERPFIANAAIRSVAVPCCKCIDGREQRVSINTGSAPWHVTKPGSTAAQPVVGASNGAWAAIAPAAWVGAPGNPTAGGDYVYVLNIEVPRCVIAAPVRVSGSFAADNQATVFLGNNQLAVSGGAPTFGFQPAAITSFSGQITTPGMHSLRVIVKNISSATGLIVRADVASACPKELERE